VFYSTNHMSSRDVLLATGKALNVKENSAEWYGLIAQKAVRENCSNPHSKFTCIIHRLGVFCYIIEYPLLYLDRYFLVQICIGKYSKKF